MLKKIIITIVVTVLVLIATLVGMTHLKELESVKKERDVYENKVKDFEKKYTEIQDLLTVMTPETFKEQVASGKRMYVYVGRPDCSDCSLLEQQLVKYIKTHDEVARNLVFVNVRILRTDEAKWSQFKKDYSVLGTPHFALWENGKQISKSEWTEKENYSIELFETWGKSTGLVK